MPIFNNPQAPSRANVGPQGPRNTVDIGGSDNSDMALMLALIDMLNRTDESKDRRDLDRKMFDFQKDMAEDAAASRKRSEYTEEARVLGEQLPAFSKRRKRAQMERKADYSIELDETALKGTNAPGMNLFLNGLRRLRTMSESEAQRFIDSIPGQAKKVISSPEEPLARLFAAKRIDLAIREYVGLGESGGLGGKGGLHSNALWEIYQDRLSGVKEMAQNALLEKGNALSHFDSQAADFISNWETGVRGRIGKGRTEGDHDLSYLGEARNFRDAINNPELTPFQPEAYKVREFDVLAPRKDVESGKAARTAEIIPGARRIIADKTAGALTKVARLPASIKKAASELLFDATRFRGETEFKTTDSSILDTLLFGLSGLPFSDVGEALASSGFYPRFPDIFPDLPPAPKAEPDAGVPHSVLEGLPNFLDPNYFDPFAFTGTGPPSELRRPPYSGGGGASF